VARSAAVGSEAVSGCLDWPTTKLLRVPWNSSANNNTGRTNAGPSYYGEGKHQYCSRTTGSNDYFALDFSFREWDQILAPAGAQVLYYGWATGGYQGYGRIVMLDLGDGYQYLAAHLRGFGAIYYIGQWISDGTIIGGAGGSGDSGDGRWTTHLHQAIYRNAVPSGFGAYYSGQSVQPRHVKYYKDGITPRSSTKPLATARSYTGRLDPGCTRSEAACRRLLQSNTFASRHGMPAVNGSTKVLDSIFLAKVL